MKYKKAKKSKGINTTKKCIGFSNSVTKRKFCYVTIIKILNWYRIWSIQGGFIHGNNNDNGSIYIILLNPQFKIQT